MRRYFGLMMLSVFVLSLSSFSFAFGKEQRCSVGEVSTLEHRDGVTVRTVSFVEEALASMSEPEAGSKPPVANHKSVNAHVYIPDSADAVPAILFSHSGIHTYQGTTSLLPFAMAMARAGAASIVLDRVIQWDPYDEAANRDASVMDCASRWFVSEVRVDVSRVVSAGNYHHPQHIYHSGEFVFSVGFATRGGAEEANHDAMMSVRGQAKMAHHLLLKLKLPDINPEWLKVEATPDDEQVASAAK